MAQTGRSGGGRNRCKHSLRTKDGVIRKLPHVTCPADEPYHCYLGRFENGRVITDFRWGNDLRMKVLDVGRVFT